MSRAVITCARCNRRRTVHARGLCHTCHAYLRDNGGLADYSTRRDRMAERNAPIIAALRQGQTVSDVAASLGLTYDTVRSVARVEGFVGNGNGGIPVTWLREMDVAPTQVPCHGKTMDTDGLQPKELHPDRNPAIRAGLALCASCPLATRQWCLDVMDPRGHGKEWQGIAGGVVWSHGRVVYFEPGALEAAA